MSTNWLDKLVFGFVFDVNQEVWRRRVVRFLLKYLFTVLDFGNITVIIFAPNIVGKVVYIDPVVAKADGPAVDKD